MNMGYIRIAKAILYPVMLLSMYLNVELLSIAIISAIVFYAIFRFMSFHCVRRFVTLPVAALAIAIVIFNTSNILIVQSLVFFMIIDILL